MLSVCHPVSHCSPSPTIRNVELNPGPVVIDPTVSFACLNVRSASAITNTIDKPYLLQEFICDNSLDIFALTETWFQPDTPSNVINSVVPPGYSVINSPRNQGRGGGLAFIHRSKLPDFDCQTSGLFVRSCSVVVYALG